MPIRTDTSEALSLLERIQRAMKETDDIKMSAQCSNDLNTLIAVLESPVFRGIMNIQESLKELRRQVTQHPSIVPADFDITREGKLVMHISPDGAATARDPEGDRREGEGGGAGDKDEKEEEEEEEHLVSKAKETTLEVKEGPPQLLQAGAAEAPSELSPAALITEVQSGASLDIKDDVVVKLESQVGLDGTLESEGVTLESDDVPKAITNVTLDQELQRAVQAAAQGREIHHIQMFKPDGSSLGFSVVGLRSEQRGELGIYVQEIQPTGIAAKDGRLQNGDQILAIDGQVLDSNISHKQAISILQQATRLVDLVVARSPPEDSGITPASVPPPPDNNTTDMLNTEWAQVEVIDLINDGSGLGFGIIGGRSTGVVVKTILPGGVADRDARLQSGDHILQIGEVNLRGMGSDQVAAVLRHSGSHVRLIVARPIEPASPDFQVGRTPPIVATRVLNDPEELARHLHLLQNGYPIPSSGASEGQQPPPPTPTTNGHFSFTNGERENGPDGPVTALGDIHTVTTEAHLHYQQEKDTEGRGGGDFESVPPTKLLESSSNLIETGIEATTLLSKAPEEEPLTLMGGGLPEMETLEVELAKDHQGLGITIAGYVCEREELSGIFVKSINAGSAADRNGQIQVNDQIVKVDGQSLSGLSNHAAVDVLRATGQVVKLQLARYLRGPKYEQLQQAIANSELKTTPTTPNPPRAALMGEMPSSEALRTALGDLELRTSSDITGMPLGPSIAGLSDSYVEAVNPALTSNPLAAHVVDPLAVPPSSSLILESKLLPTTITNTTTTTTTVSEIAQTAANDVRLEDLELMIDSNYTGELKASVENAISRKWRRHVGPEFDIVVAQLSKFEEGGGLGISLEGTVDVEDGREVRPHHYIRSILPNGPVGKNGKLLSGDELLEVNGQKLLGLNHVEVVSILKELPQWVRLVCGRRFPGAPPLHPIDAPTADRDAFAARNILGGSLQNLLPASERLVKAKSDGSLASSTTATNDTSFSRMKSRSLEPLSGLAMWSSEPQVIELSKGDRGLGFSILDYQDPLNPQETVIVIRSLVPGGVAEKDGRLIPGDRLVAVNGTCLENATLDQAVAALKGAPKGPVSIAVAKPISVLESAGQLDAFLGELGSSGEESDGADVDDGVEAEGEEEEEEEDEEEEEEEEGSGELGEGRRKLMRQEVFDQGDKDSVDAPSHRAQDSVILEGPDMPPLPASGPPPAHVTAKARRPEASDEDLIDYNDARPGQGGAPLCPNDPPTSREGVVDPSSLTLSLESSTVLCPHSTYKPLEVVSPVNVYKASVLMVPVATERLIGGNVGDGTNANAVVASSTTTTTTTTAVMATTTTTILASTATTVSTAHLATGPDGDVVFSGDEDSSPHASPSITRWSSQVPPLPRQLERNIKIKKGGDQLGVNIEVVDNGVNGVVVSSLVRNGAVHKDGRLHSGDFILAVNNESMRNITNSQARAILRRTQLVSTDVSITYIPGQDAAIFRESSLLQYRASQQQQKAHQQQQQLPSQQQQLPTQPSTQAEPPKQTSPRSPYIRSDSSEDELGSSDLTRSVTAPSFITRDIRSRDPSQEDLLGSSGSLPQPQREPPAGQKDFENAADGLTVINIKHALSDTLVRDDSRVSSVHISQEPSEAPDDSEEGPFTITFKNVSKLEYQPGVSLQDGRGESEDHEVAGVLQSESGITVAPSEGRSNTSSPMLDGKHWGPERTVEVRRDDRNSLGISIVGGKVDLSWSGSSVTGIFIKNVLPASPAGKSGLLKTGDRILEVEGVDLRNATHEKAVEVIKNTGNPVTFVVQSLVQWTPTNSGPSSRDVSRLGQTLPTAVTPARTPSPELIQPGLTDQRKQILQANMNQAPAASSAKFRQSTEDSSDDEDTRELQGRINTKAGVEIDRASAGALKRSKLDASQDPEKEDEFGYTKKKIQKKYGNLPGEVVLVDLQKGQNGLGISLAGNKDRKQMSVFVCGLNPNGNAFKDGRIHVGDELLEVNGNVVHGRCHLNASCIVKGIPGPTIKLIVLRKKSALQDMAVKPITQFPVTLEDESPEEKYARFKGLTNVIMKKGQTGLGIMIIEGKHAEYGQGIFISDLQEGSPAAEAGLRVGDLILCVNKEEMVGTDYDQATNILKKTEGVINMWVCNASRVEGAKPAAGAPGKPGTPTPKKDAPPKPPIAPKPALPLHKSTSPTAAATTMPVQSVSTVGSSTTSATATSILSSSSTSSTSSSSSTSTTTNMTSDATSAQIASVTPPVSLTATINIPPANSTSESTTSSDSTPMSTEEPPKDPATAEITPGRETTIEIVKEKMGLGLSIVGGSDTLLGAIIIHEVYPDGAAAKDGRLKPGDQILEVNSENFREITHQKALSVLRQTPSKVKMVVYREEGQKEEDLYDVITVQLTKKSGKGLGLSIVGRKNGPGVFISDVVPGGVAESDGRLMQGDQILEVNSKDLRQATQEQAAAILKCAPGSVSMKLGRLKAGRKGGATNNATWPVTISEGSMEVTGSSGSTIPPSPPMLSFHTQDQYLQQMHLHQPQHQKQPSQDSLTSAVMAAGSGGYPVSSSGGPRSICLERGEDGLGFSIVGGFGSKMGNLPIYVKNVFERGAAAREGAPRRGDQILEVNNHSLQGCTHAEAVAILKEARGAVKLTILPSK